MARRLPTIVGLVGVAAALGLLNAPPAAADPTEPQTVTFTSDAPENVDWFNYGSPHFDYTATASATSGLPATYSIDPASADVCWINFMPGSPPSAGIRYSGPGTCTIHADQAGNDEYLPAPQASQSFVIDKVQPQLIVLRQTSSPGRSRTFRATLTRPTKFSSFFSGHWGFPGQVVTFSLAGQPACSGTTDEAGVATCTKTLSLRDWWRFAFTASYTGDDRYKPVSRKGPTFGDKNPVWPEF